jgi:osmotically-inducible protein OsmY
MTDHNHGNAFGQPQNDRYKANDNRPYQTGNVSWEGRQSHRGKGPKGYRRSDERIRDEVYHKLTDDDMVDATEIEVQVNNSEVTLNGTVQDRNERRRAEDVIEQISGVEHVQNNLRVRKDGRSPSDEENRSIDDMEKRSAGTSGHRNIEVM